MANVEYSISLRDMASAPMRGFARTVQQSNGVVNSATRNMLRRFVSTQRAIQDNARATQQMQRNVESLARSVDSLTQRLERAARVKPNGGGILAMLGGKGAVGAAAIGATVMAVTNGIGGAMRAAFERQKIQASYNILAGGRAQGEAIVGELKTLMRDTMLGGEVFDIARTMMAFGVKGNVAGRIEQIGNVAMGDAGRMTSLGLALSQMSAAGKLQGQDRLQMINAGWNPINTLAEMTGKSAAQLNEEMSKGLITSDMVWKALEYATGEGGQFGGVLDAIAKTPAGQYMLMMGQWQEMMVSLGQQLMPIATDVMKFVNESVMPLVEVYLPYVREAVSYVWGVLQGWIQAMSPIKDIMTGWTEESSLQNQYLGGMWELWQAIVPLVGKVVGFASQLSADIVGMLNDSELFKLSWSFVLAIAKGILGMVSAIVDAIKWLWNNLLKPIYDKTTEWVNGIMRALGMVSRVSGFRLGGGSSMPGVSGGASAVAEAQALAGLQQSNGSATSSATGGVSSGGPKVVNITVNKLLDSINVSAANLKEGADEIEKVVLDTLARVLAQGAVMA